MGGGTHHLLWLCGPGPAALLHWPGSRKEKEWLETSTGWGWHDTRHSSLRQPPPHQTLTACQTLHCVPSEYHFNFDVPATLGWTTYYPHLIGKETEAQRA